MRKAHEVEELAYRDCHGLVETFLCRKGHGECVVPPSVGVRNIDNAFGIRGHADGAVTARIDSAASVACRAMSPGEGRHTAIACDPSVVLEAFRQRTHVDVSTVRRDLAQVRERLVLFDDEEFSVGGRCMATPV